MKRCTRPGCVHVDGRHRARWDHARGELVRFGCIDCSCPRFSVEGLAVPVVDTVIVATVDRTVHLQLEQAAANAGVALLLGAGA
jgi:hypothetical protein